MSVFSTDKPVLKKNVATVAPAGEGRSTAARWDRRSSFYALADQSVVSAGNFVTNVLIARFSDQSTYGVFALCLAGILFLNNLHAAVVLYPLSMNISTGAGSRKPAIVNSLAFTLAACVCLAIPAVPLFSKAYGMRLAISITLALFAWQAQETCRRALMATLSTWRTLAGDIVSYPGQAVLIYALARYQHHLELQTVFTCMAATSLAGAAIQFVQLRPPLVVRELRATAKGNWALGRWGAGAALLQTVSSHAFLAILGALHGASSAAELQSLLNIGNLTNPVTFGISNSTLPRVAAVNSTAGARRAARAGASIAVQGAVLVGPYLLLVALAPTYVLTIFYGVHSPYLASGNALRLIAVAYGFAYAASVLGSIFNGLGRPRVPFNGLLVSSVFSVTVGFPLAAASGVGGAAAGSLIGSTARAASQALALRKVLRESAE